MQSDPDGGWLSLPSSPRCEVYARPVLSALFSPERPSSPTMKETGGVTPDKCCFPITPIECGFPELFLVSESNSQETKHI